MTIIDENEGITSLHTLYRRLVIGIHAAPPV